MSKRSEGTKVDSTDLLDALTDGELSALICACQFADNAAQRGHLMRPPWAKYGTAAHRKLIKAEFARASNDRLDDQEGSEE